MLKKRNSAIMFLEENITKYENNIAVDDAGALYTFYDIRKKSRAAASAIINMNIKSQNIAVMLPKNVDCICAFFACLYSAKTYVPLDYNDAEARVTAIASAVDCEMVITDEKNISKFQNAGINAVLYEEIALAEPNDDAIEKHLKNVCDLDAAYIMHTSGSTGVPKGVVVSHRSIIDFTEWAVKLMELDQTSVIGLQSPFHFDASVFDIYACIAAGARIAILPDALIKFPSMIVDFLEEKNVTCVFWVPGILADIANSGLLENHLIPNLKTLTFVGEIMPTKQFNIWQRCNPNRTYINLYGPTEATVACTAYKIDKAICDSEPIPIGKAGANKRILILNESNMQAKVGQIGEICILGSCLAFGYYKRKEETDNVFVQNPLNTSYREMMYRTGDFGYENSDGEIIFSGRRDSQVKIHGIRVELGDIENAACCLDGIEKACAVFDNEKITLFLQTKQKFEKRKFNLLLKTHIPKYMLPDNVVCVPIFPTNKNGKVDRKKLIAGSY